MLGVVLALALLAHFVWPKELLTLNAAGFGSAKIDIPHVGW
jgi:hypothetical protein